MSDGNRGAGAKAVAALFIVLAIVGAVWVIYGVGSLSGKQEGRSIEAAARHEADGKQQAIQACVSEPITRRAECVYDAIAAAEDAKRAEQDLQAQQGMHFWAVSMVLVGLLQTGVAGAALWFLREDLRQNRRSAEAQLRPYIQLKTRTFPEAHRLGKEGSNIPIHVVNKGQTPALNVEQWSQSFIASYPLKEETDIPSDWVYAGKGAVVHSQSDEHDFGLKFTNLAEHDLGGFVRETSERTTALYIAAKVLYTDHFGRSYVEQYCASVHYPNGSLVRTEIAPFGNVST